MMILGDAFANPEFQAIGWILLLTAGLTAYYTFRVYFRVFMGPVEYEPGDEVHGAAQDNAAHRKHAEGEHLAEEAHKPVGETSHCINALASATAEVSREKPELSVVLA